MTDQPRVALVLLPLQYEAASGLVSGRHAYIPNNAIQIYHTLLRAGAAVEVLHSEHLLDGRKIDKDTLIGALRNVLEQGRYDDVIIPISLTESHNEFSNVPVELFVGLVQAISHRGKHLILTGRVLNEKKLSETVGVPFYLFPTSYDEDLQIARHVLGRSELALSPIDYGAGLDESFYLTELMEKRAPEHLVILYGQRGCPHKCTFCERYLIWPETRVRRAELSDSESLIRYYRDTYGRKWFMVLDPLFNTSPGHVQRFCDMIEPLGVHWHAEVRVDRITEEQLSRMKKAGCYQVLFGIESFDPEITHAVDKVIDVSKVKPAVRACERLGINPLLSFIAGLGPSVQKAYQHIQRTTDFLLAQRLTVYQIVPFFFYQGTREYIASFGLEDNWIFPRCYHPFKLLMMIDLVMLFHNKMKQSQILLGNYQVRCLMDLFRLMQRYPRLRPDDGLIIQLSKHTKYTDFLLALFRQKSFEETSALAKEMVQSWEKDEPRGRYLFAQETKELGPASERLGNWL